ncbi:Ulp1 peptidase [Ranunculus cassubicifolius]
MAQPYWLYGSTMGGSDSDTDSQSEYEVSDVESEPEQKPNKYTITDSDDDDDSKDEQRDIIPKRLKRYEQMLGIIAQMKNPININDWVSLPESFDKLNQQLDKVLQVRRSKKVPSLYIRALVMLEDSLVQALGNKDAKKKMSSSNAKALNIMKQRLKKNNKVYEDLISKFRENHKSRVDEETEEDSDSEYEIENPSEIVNAVSVDKDAPKEASEITWDTVDKKLKEIIAARGKKGTGRVEQVEQLTFLIKLAKTPAQELEILLNVVSAQFNVNPSLSGHMPISIWKDCARNVLMVVDLLRQYRNIVVDESVETEEGETQKGADYNGTIRVKGNLVPFLEGLGVEFYKSLRHIDSHSLEYVERLRDEVMLFAIAQYVQEYLQSVGDFTGAAKAALKQMELLYYKPSEVFDSMRKMVENADDELVLRKPTFPEDCRELMDSLASLIYKYGDGRTKARAMLCDVYHHAITDHFSIARDLMLMSHLQDEVQKLDVSTQMLFNRAMAQLGMCAFRCGLISEAHSCLSDLCSTGAKIKDLLGQGFSHNRFNTKNSEEEKQEQMPYHMHINLDLLESIHLTCAMILEVPNMAAITHDPKRKVISKTYRRLFEFNKKQIFIGPPENVRDHIVAASGALKTGDYEKTFDFIKCLNAWNSLKDQVNILEMVETKIKEAALKTYLFTYSSSYEGLSLDSLTTMFGLSESHIQSILGKMMILEEINANWDLNSRCLVFHKAEYTKLQSLAYELIYKITSFAESNEKAYESKHKIGREYRGITA